MASVLQISSILRSFRQESQLWHRSCQGLRAIHIECMRNRSHQGRHLSSVAASGRHNKSHTLSRAKDDLSHADVRGVQTNDSSYAQKSSASTTALDPKYNLDGSSKDSTKLAHGERSHTVANDVRQLMRKLPTPVVVISTSTAIHHGPKKADKHDHSRSYGVTISSFNTVTLGPPSMVSFNLRKPSRTFDAIRSTKLFRVSIFEGNEDGKAIATAFLKLQHSEAYAFLQTKNPGAVTNQELVSSENTRAPSFESAIASLSCEMDQCIDVGDHVIVVAKVVSVNATNNLDRIGLLYFNGDFGRAQTLLETEMSTTEPALE